MRLSIAVAAALCVTSLSAMQFQTLGYKSVGMGGAAVASSSGSLTSYNNPALLAKPEYDTEISVGGGASYQDYGAGASMQALEDSGFIDTMDLVAANPLSLTPANALKLVDGKDIILGMDGKGVGIAPQIYFATQISNFGIGVFTSSDIVATAHVDQNHNQLILDTGINYLVIDDFGTPSYLTYAAGATTYQNTSIEYAINNNLVYTKVEAIALVEVPLAYGHKFELSNGNLMVGGAFKFMSGTALREQSNIDNTGSSNTLEATTTTFGLDLGAAFEPSFSNDLTLALVAKDLNSPKFDFADGGSVKVSPKIRAGVAYDIFESLEVAADIDITKNKTFFQGFNSQMMGGGVNFHPSSWFALRAGLMTNMDSADKAGLIYTGGIGFGLKWLQLDLSGQMSTNETTVGDVTFPQYMKVNLALISRW